MTFSAIENSVLLPTAIQGVPYEVAFSVNGATAGVLTTSAGSTQTGKVALPAGLSYGATGRISGTPTVCGSFLLSVKVTDGTSTVDNIACTLVIVEGGSVIDAMGGRGTIDGLN